MNDINNDNQNNLEFKISEYKVDRNKLNRDQLLELNNDYTLKNLELLNYNHNLELIIEDLQCQIDNYKQEKIDPSNLVKNMKFDNYKKFFFKLKKIIGSNIKNIVEIGAHFGEDTLRFFYFFPDAKIYSFEADPRNFNIMKKLIHNENCFIYDYAVCDKDYETLTFYQSYRRTHEDFYKPKKYNFISYEDFLDLNLNGSGSSSLKKSDRRDLVESHEIIVKTISLDSWARDNNVKNIDLIWIDVQGAEKEVIMGSKEILEKTKFVYIEYGETSYDGAMSRLETLELFYDLNFKLIHDFSENMGNGDLLFEYSGDRLCSKFCYRENIHVSNNEYLRKYKYNYNERIVKYIFNKLKINQGFFFEINCGDGRQNSISRYLFENSWNGFFTENDNNKFKLLENNYKHYKKKILYYEKIKINSKEKYLSLIEKYNIKNIDFLYINSFNTQFLMYIDIIYPKIICIKGGQYMYPLDERVNLKDKETVISQSLLYFNNIFHGKYDILLVTDCVYFIHHRYKKFFNYEQNLIKLYIDSLICNLDILNIIKKLKKENINNKLIELLLGKTDNSNIEDDSENWFIKNYDNMISNLQNIKLNMNN